MTKKIMSQQSKKDDSEMSSQTEASTEPNTGSVNPSRIEKKVNNKIK